MPPKNAKKGNPKGMSDAELDQIIANINSKEEQSIVAKKAGMTKAQLKEAETKAIQQQRVENMYSKEQIRAYMEAQKIREHQTQMMEIESTHVNAFTPLDIEKQQWHKTSSGKYIRLEQFDGSEEKMSLCVNIFNSELTEPYVDFTYMHFILGWKDLCMLAYEYEGADEPTAPTDASAPSTGGKFVAAIVSSVQRKAINKPLRGYIAMLAVAPESRKNKIASVLVTATVDLMKKKGCDEVSLETPADALPALNLYTALGFAKTKFLSRYYLQGQDAYRLKLFLKPAPAAESFKMQLAAQQAALAKQQAAAAEASKKAEATN